MSKVIVTQSKLDTLASVIGGKSNTEVPLTLDEMIEAADSITTGGGTATLQTKTATYTPTTSQQTDTITPDVGYDGIDEVDVTVNAITLANMADNGVDKTYKTLGNNRYCELNPYDDYDSAGYVYMNTGKNYYGAFSYRAVASGTTITPTESQQTLGGADWMMESAATISAIPSNYVGSGITQRTSSDLMASTLTVTAPSGYYSSSASKTLTDANLAAENIKKDVSIFGVTGSYEGGGGSSMMVATSSTTPGSASSSISFAGLSGEPTSFVITSAVDIATGGTKAVSVVYDGTSCHGMDITSQAEADTNYSQSYSAGTLTVTATSASFQAVEYKLVYTYGGTAGNIGTADVQVGSGATSITFTGLEDEPEYFSCIFKSSFSTSSGYQRVIEVTYDGSDTYGLAMDSGEKALTSWSYSYSAGSLTITSTGTNNGGYFHQPGYYQLTYAIGGDQTLQTKTVTPTTSTQNITADTAQGYTALKKVVVNPIPGEYIIPSGNYAITSNGSGIDVAQYATVSVNVPGGGGSDKATYVYSGLASRTANSYGATSASVTVTKAGTYDISYVAIRGSSSGTMGTNLHIGSTSGANNTTWNNGTYGQYVALTNQSISANTTVTIYATSGNTSRTIYVGQLIVAEV